MIVATSMVVMMLVELKPTDENGNYITATPENPGQTMRLQITKREKQRLLTWMDQHFPELKDGTADDDLADPAKMVRLYYTGIENRLANDEPSRHAGAE